MARHERVRGGAARPSLSPRTGGRRGGIDVGQAFSEDSGPVFVAVARQVRAPKHLIEDACQFGWEQAWRHRARLNIDDPSVLRGYVIRVARNHALEQLKKPQPSAVQDNAELADTSEGRDELADLDARMQAIDMLKQVTPQQQRVLVLWAAGYHYDEIATELGISRRAVDKALVKARARLRGER